MTDWSAMRRTAVGTAIALMIILILLVCTLVLLVSWKIAGTPIATAAEQFAQSQQMLAALAFVVGVVGAGATVYYAKLTRDVVAEMRASRLDDEARAERARADALDLEIRDQVVALTEAAARVIALVAMINGALAARVVWFGRRRYALGVRSQVNDAMFLATSAFNRLSMLDTEFAGQAGELWDVLSDVSASTGRRPIATDDPRVVRAAELRAWFIDRLRPGVTT